MMEFHVSRQARDRYHFDLSLFGYHGNVIFANFHAARLFAQKINQQRDLVSYPEQAVKAGQVNALGLMDEIFHHVVSLYQQQRNPQAFAKALQFLNDQFGGPAIEHLLLKFIQEFPPVSVYLGQVSPEEYLEGETEGIPNREALVEELMMLWITNQNPATHPFVELFDDNRLASETIYRPFIQSLHEFFETQPFFGPDRQNLIDFLRSPAIAIPYSLTGQLEYIRERWAELLGKFLYRLLSSLDLVKEEEKASFFGPGPTLIPVYDRFHLGELEVEAFSPDREWMPRLVLLAKNTYVWLYQLSQKYQRTIQRLDQIPDEELAELASWGFTGLWLIGLWERSRASARIKQLCGNPEAIASAYSLYDYEIASDLGGESAYQNLRERAWQYGIRLASDMVPNHMGIDSRWLVNHPDWFIQLDYSPFPSYTFTGPDLSSDPSVTIQLEDHYYDRTDAAVVFKYYDHRDGRTRYIYHGNDGTSMPWNDTAQLNYLIPEVREAVIQTILHVARKFPIIRFDAAMTLAKRHYQRLWYPEPGTGGAIPSRAEHGMTREQFNTVFPKEFWREVVDRVAQEAPDTLLLAEAFWLMEGYFVRTLGMHRVYNSAFMNMLRNEENNKYRALIKNTLEFDPEILKRYVNFMNNPDERTAVDQFGKGDKYFGICVLMSTLPGLPMFGHGQLEGYSEKYGMEFRKPMWNEQPDRDLIERHRREIAPILHRRALFAGIENFLFYDFVTPNGWVDENVFAYSNGIGSQRALVVVHNRFASTEGWIRTSTPFLVKGQGNRSLVQKSLIEGLGLNPDANWYTIARDQATGLEYLFSNAEIAQNGLHLSLNAYEYHVFMDFQQVKDDEWQSYRQLYEYLNGKGVPNIQEAIRELVLRPVLTAFREIIHPGYVRYLVESRLKTPQQTLPSYLLEEVEAKYNRLLDGVSAISGYNFNRKEMLSSMKLTLQTALSIQILGNRYPLPTSKKYAQAMSYLGGGISQNADAHWLTLIGWIFTGNLGKIAGVEDAHGLSRSWLDEWRLSKAIYDSGMSLGLNEQQSSRSVSMVRILIEQQNWFEKNLKTPVRQIMEKWLENDEIRRYLGVNRYKEILWFNQEAFEDFVWWMYLLSVFETLLTPNASASLFTERAILGFDIVQKLLKGLKISQYQVAKLLEAL